MSGSIYSPFMSRLMWVKTLRPWFHEMMSNSNFLSGNSCGKSPGRFFLLYWNIFPCTINILEQGWVKGVME